MSGNLFPTIGEYQLAMMHADQFLKIGTLRSGRVTLKKDGFAKQWPGAYAVVFEYRHASGAWALRCFHKDVPDARAHYAEVAAELVRAGLPYFAAVEYHQEGIVVGGRKYPVVQMKWVEGVPLKEYLWTNARNSTALLQLAERWQTMTTALHHHHIAHGDLQHENIFITSSGAIVLLDYDTMVLPSLVGKPDPIVGLPGYQHPKRQELKPAKHLNIDAFSSVVIYLAFVALAERPALWQELSIAPREGLLFDAADFSDPNAASFTALRRLSSEVAFLSERVFELAQTPDPTGLPTLENLLAEHRRPRVSLPDWRWPRGGPGAGPPINPSDPATGVHSTDWRYKKRERTWLTWSLAALAFSVVLSIIALGTFLSARARFASAAEADRRHTGIEDNLRQKLAAETDATVALKKEAARLKAVVSDAQERSRAAVTGYQVSLDAPKTGDYTFPQTAVSKLKWSMEVTNSYEWSREISPRAILIGCATETLKCPSDDLPNMTIAPHDRASLAGEIPMTDKDVFRQGSYVMLLSATDSGFMPVRFDLR